MSDNTWTKRFQGSSSDLWLFFRLWAFQYGKSKRPGWTKFEMTLIEIVGFMEANGFQAPQLIGERFLLKPFMLSFRTD